MFPSEPAVLVGQICLGIAATGVLWLVGVLLLRVYTDLQNLKHREETHEL